MSYSTQKDSVKRSDKRYGENTGSQTDATPKMLTQQLRALENDQLIIRKVYPVVPPKVEYSLSEFGLSMVPILESMYEWGQRLI